MVAALLRRFRRFSVHDYDALTYMYDGAAREVSLTCSTFTAKERDTESGLDMFGARYYGSSLGRFMTPDWAEKPTDVPYANFGNPQSLNLYSYVNNNPTTTRDPDGHDGDDPCGCTISPEAWSSAQWYLERLAANTWSNIKADTTTVANAIKAAAPGAMAGPDPIPGLGQTFKQTNGQQAQSAQPAEGQSTPAKPEPPSGNDLNRSSSTKQTGAQGQNTTTTVKDEAGSTTYKTTPGKTGGQSTIVVRKDANGNTVYVKQEARTTNRDFTKPPDHVHYKKPIDKEVN